MCQGFVQNYHSLVACRLLLGLFTGGISAGLTLFFFRFFAILKFCRYHVLDVSLLFALGTSKAIFNCLDKWLCCGSFWRRMFSLGSLILN